MREIKMESLELRILGKQLTQNLFQELQKNWICSIEYNSPYS